MFEHFHADDRVVALAVPRIAQGLDRQEAHPRQRPESIGAALHLLDVDVGADRFAERFVGEGDEGAVTAPVIEEGAAGLSRGELVRQREATAVAPGHGCVAAEELLARVMPLLEQVAGWWGHGRSRDGSAPDGAEHHAAE